MNLRKTIDQLAHDFATSVLGAIRGASLEEILGEGKGGGGGGGRAPKANAVRREAVSTPAPARKRGGRLPRRSEDEINEAVEKVVAVLKENKGGLRAEEIREQLGIDRKELPRPLAEALRKKRISKKGQKRATTYFAR
ncbi:hypothetical protein [Pendulispora albinea]|uniref:DNA-binding protein n=1 Tax=Pendulispora albinea TaxID=2741071 RepID=A0ABZ2LW07_9BACT